MKLLLLIGSLECGGAERVLVDLANSWANKGWDVTVATIASKDKDYYALSRSVRRITFNINYVGGIGKRLIPTFQIISRIRQLLKTGQYTIVKSYLTTMNVLLVISSLGLKSNTKLIGSEHIHPPMYQFKSPVQRLILQVYKKFEAIVVLTTKSANWLKAHGKLSDICIIPNAITPTLYQAEKINRFEKAKGQTRFKLLAVGRLHYQKGFDQLIHVFSKLNSQFTNWELLIAGEGAERVNLENLISAYGLEDRVQLLGKIADMADLYASADCFVMSSRFEGFGNVLVEAMASGLPVISFDCDAGPSDIIENEVNGLLVPPGDVGALHIGLSRLMKNKNLRERLGNQATEVRSRFAPDTIAIEWENLFKKVLG